MSALGQKQTYALQRAMSALPLIATAKADFRKRSCLLYPRKQTCAVRPAMSALGQKRTLHRSLNDNVGTGEYGRNRFGGESLDGTLDFTGFACIHRAYI
jgi:hypothetical protein